MHDWIDLVPIARTICAGLVAVTRITIILLDLRRRRTEAPTDEQPVRSDPTTPDRHADRSARTSRALKGVLTAAQIGAALASASWWLHEEKLMR